MAVFDQVVRQRGRGYDHATGYFTAVTPGLYRFQIHVVTSNNKDACLQLMKTGSPNAIVRAIATRDAQSEAASNSVVLEMAKGDKVWPVACKASSFGGGTGTHFSKTTVFSGHLVRPEHCKKTSSSTSEASEAGRVEVSLLVLTAVLVLYCTLLYSRVLQPMMA